MLNCIELLASVELYDVIRDQRIIVEADQKIEELLEYLPGASEELCRGLLEVRRRLGGLAAVVL
jgi:hypothetical protein